MPVDPGPTHAVFEINTEEANSGPKPFQLCCDGREDGARPRAMKRATLGVAAELVALFLQGDF